MSRVEEILVAAQSYSQVKLVGLFVLTAMIAYRVLKLIAYARPTGVLLTARIKAYLVYGVADALTLIAYHTALMLSLAVHMPLLLYMVASTIGLERVFEDVATSTWSLHVQLGLPAGIVAVTLLAAYTVKARRMESLTLHTLAVLLTGIAVALDVLPVHVHVLLAYTLAIHLAIRPGYHWLNTIAGHLRNPFELESREQHLIHEKLRAKER